jgi:carbon storage regulator
MKAPVVRLSHDRGFFYWSDGYVFARRRLMLVLSRKVGEQIVIGGNVLITVVDAFNGRIRLGITAPPEISVLRKELLLKMQERDEGESLATC